jgi:hypothetical protein
MIHENLLNIYAMGRGVLAPNGTRVCAEVVGPPGDPVLMIRSYIEHPDGMEPIATLARLTGPGAQALRDAQRIGNAITQRWR